MKYVVTQIVGCIIFSCFFVVYLFLGNSFTEQLNLNISYEQETKKILFKLCNPSWGYVSFNDNIYFWNLSAPSPNGVDLYFANNEGGNFKTLHNEPFTFSRAIIFPKTCLTRQMDLKPHNVNLSDVDTFKVILKFYGISDYRKETPYTTIESEWFNL